MSACVSARKCETFEEIKQKTEKRKGKEEGERGRGKRKGKECVRWPTFLFAFSAHSFVRKHFNDENV